MGEEMKSNLKLLATRLFKLAASIAYKFICLFFSVRPTRVVFATSRHDTLKDNLFYLHKEMRKKKPELEYITLIRKIDNKNSAWWKSLGYLIKVYYYLATARFFIIDDYYFPLYLVNVRKKTEIIQLWHASGPLKKVGLSLKGLPDGPSESYLRIVPVHSNYDRVVVNSDREIEFYSEAFEISKEKIAVLGSPRTDLLFDKINDSNEKLKFLKKYPRYKDKELILYAPTFRGRDQDSEYIPNFNIERLKNILLKKNKVLLFNLHPYMEGKKDLITELDENAFYWNNHEYTIEELLLISDALITDYSSVIYDYSILEKPMALYCYDYEEYKTKRGFYLDIKNLVPTTFFKREEDLLNWIISDKKSTSEVKVLKNTNFKYTDGKSTCRIINLLL